MHSGMRKTASDYHALAGRRSFKWVGEEALTTKHPTEWKCQSGHVWAATYSNISKGSRCPLCSENNPHSVKQKTPKDYHDVAAQCGLEWLGPEVANVFTKTRWRCQQGHVREATYQSVRRSNNCPHCTRNVQKTPADYHALAARFGFKWLGPEVKSVHDYTNWQCAKGHVWQSKYNYIYRHKDCPKCSKRARLTEADFHALARENGFKWLGVKVVSALTKTEWECERGHRRAARYNTIQQGIGCPQCIDMVNGRFVSKPQRLLCEMLEGELNEPLGRYRIDVTVKRGTIRIAVEYDAWAWHSGNENHDVRRDKALIAAGWRVLHIKTNKLLPTKAQLDEAIAKLLDGDTYVEIVLPDWGKGPTFKDRHPTFS